MWFGVDLGGRRIIKKIFFKQKTAYEIQSCDWSSDVCSSDLSKEAAWDDQEEGGDDVKSSWPLWAGLHTCYNGGYNGKQ